MIELEQVTKIYNRGKGNVFEALHGVTLSIEAGEMVAVMGTSGAGKSTLLHIMGCIDCFEEGRYLIDGTDVGGLTERQLAIIRNEKIGIVMQDFALVEDFSVRENVALPLDFECRRKRKDRRSRGDMVLDALQQVKMREYADKKVKNLSGGQKQRVAIARAIINNPSFILADEPTGALDSKTSDEIIQVFEQLNESGRTIIIVTHDARVAERCGRVIRIEDGRIVPEYTDSRNRIL